MNPLLALPFVALLLAGCLPHAQDVRPEQAAPAPAAQPTSATTPDEESVKAETARLPAVELTPRLLHGFLLAEIAGQRGQLGNSAQLYLDLAEETRDPRVARRATEIGLHGRRLDLALAAARIWQETDPASTRARQAFISLLAAQGRFDELRGSIAALLAAEPKHLAQNLGHLNRLFSRATDRKAVRELVEAVTEPYLQLPEAHYARALAAFDARDAVAARRAIQHALELKPDWETAALLRAQLAENRDAALAGLADFVAANPRAREARLAHARALVNAKRYAEARRQFATLLEQGGNAPEKNGDVVFALAVLSLQLDDTADAERHLRRLVEIGYAEADKARYFLGQIAEEDKRWDEALRWFAQVGPGEHYLVARLHAANVLARQGKLDEARRQLAATKTAGPREQVQLLLGEAQILREANRFADAHAALAAGLEKLPDQPELLYEIALLAEKLGRLDELESRLRRLIELKPDHAHALNALGYSLADRNERLSEARTLIERALELAPHDPFILDSQGWVLFRLGERQAALDTLNRAFGIRPDPEIAAHLGEVLWTLGRREEARQTWETARRAHPANAVLAETIKRFLP
ncbi:MAG: tetratricopeptide repeat protein [Pseudomonadota bacterium]